MPAGMDGKAVGFIETRGLAGLIAASDAAVKAGYVEIRSIERASGGLILVALVGDLASVQAAVEAGARQAEIVGNLVSSHVIPRPDAGIWKLLGIDPGAAPGPGRAIPASGPPATPAPKAIPPAGPAVPLPPAPNGESRASDGLDDLPVRELRRRARAVTGIALTGRDISRVSKTELVAAIRAARPS